LRSGRASRAYCTGTSGTGRSKRAPECEFCFCVSSRPPLFFLALPAACFHSSTRRPARSLATQRAAPASVSPSALLDTRPTDLLYRRTIVGLAVQRHSSIYEPHRLAFDQAATLTAQRPAQPIHISTRPSLHVIALDLLDLRHLEAVVRVLLALEILGVPDAAVQETRGLATRQQPKPN
jgi:hypothetical protein